MYVYSRPRINTIFKNKQALKLSRRRRRREASLCHACVCPDQQVALLTGSLQTQDVRQRTRAGSEVGAEKSPNFPAKTVKLSGFSEHNSLMAGLTIF